MEKTLGSRVTFDSQGAYPRFSIATKKNWGVLIFLTVWFILWGLGGGSNLTHLSNGISATLQLFLFAIWGLPLLFIVYALLWNGLGKETITISNGILEIKRDLVFAWPKRTFEIYGISWLGPNELPEASSPWSFNIFDWATSKCSIAFRYQEKKYGFGIQLDDGETGEILRNLRMYLPSSAFGQERRAILDNYLHFGFGNWGYYLFLGMHLLGILVVTYCFTAFIDPIRIATNNIGWVFWACYLAFLAFWMAYGANYVTPITLDNDGLWIRVFLCRRFIPWTHVHTLEHPPRGGNRVYTKYISPIHWLVGAPFHQSFTIFEGFRDKDELFWEIYRRASLAQGHPIPVKGWSGPLPRLDLPSENK